MFELISEAVNRAKGGCALAPVIVVVPNRSAMRDVSKYLATHGGAANTQALTLDLVVETLAARALAPLTPLSFPLLVASVQKVLGEDPGLFADVADQPITADALAAASWTLGSYAEPSAPDPTPLVADTLRVHRSVTAALGASHYLPHEAYAAAEPLIGDLGRLVIVQPSPRDSAEADFFGYLSEHGEVIEREEDPTGTQVVHASDADDEIRAVTRIVRKHLLGGTPGHRIGVFFGSADPYLRLIHEHFGRGHIEFAADGCHLLHHRPAARSLRRLLSLDVDVMPRSELLAIVSERAVRWSDDSNTRLPLRRVERLTRARVKVVGGADWERLATLDPTDRDAAAATSLHSFVTELRGDLTALAATGAWSDVSDHLVRLLDRYFTARSTVPSDQTTSDIAAAIDICRELGEMDGIAPSPRMASIINAIAVRIESRPERTGSSSAAVSVGSISSGMCRDLDVSIVVGAAEGILPAPRREDPLLPTSLTGRTLADEIDSQKNRFLSTLASGRHHRIVTFPRGSMRGGAEKVPSRWILPTLEALSGQQISVVEWQKQTADVETVVTVESFDVSTQTVDPRVGDSAASATEWRLRALAAVSASDRRNTLDDPVVSAGMELRGDRLRGRFTRFNGNISHIENSVTFFDGPVSASRLEEWVASPYRFFVKTLLGVDALDDPDDVAQLDPLTRGNLIHATLERYVQDTIDCADATLDHLLEIADDVLADARVDAPGWLPQLWEKDSSIIRRDLVDWFVLDQADREEGWSPHGGDRVGRQHSSVFAERDFGVEPDLIFLDLAGERIGFAGKVDRIDKHTDGRIRVTDYKSGGNASYNALSESDPTDGGTKFQLPVYGLLALTMGNDVTTRYWFVSSKAKFAAVGYPLTDAVTDVLKADIARVHNMIRSGYFPPRPPDSFWANPLVDLIGKPGLERAWASLRDVPELADYRAKYED